MARNMTPTTPERTCVGCRATDTPEAMLRVVRTGEAAPAALTLDTSRSAPGRGAWIHPRATCIASALSRGGFARSFRSPVDTARLARELEAAVHPTKGYEPLLEAG